jgi:coenzyme PQQ synthesis protein D (PqqD)
VKPALSSSSTIVAAKEQVSCDLSGQAAILNLESGLYYGLEGVGARIWDLIQEPRTVRQLRDLLTKEYDVEPERCERDLLSLLARLATVGLVEIRA